METINHHKLPLLPPEKDIQPLLTLITEAYHAIGELKGRMYRDVINPNLIVVKETAIQMQTKVVSMYELYGRVKEKNVTMNSQYARLFLDLLFERAIISAKDILQRLEQPSTQTIYNLMKKFEKAGIIREITGQKRNQAYAFDALLEIIK